MDRGEGGNRGRASIGDVMVATLFGPIVYVVTLVAVDFFLGALIGSGALVAAVFPAFIAWIWVKSSFRTS